MNTRVRRALRGLDPQRVENRVGPGTPDWAFIGGWIECKWLRGWPKRPGAMVMLPKYVPVQRAWHMRRSRACISLGIPNDTFVLLKAGEDWLLYDASDAARHLGTMDKGQTIALAIGHWPRGLDEGELKKCLTSRVARAT